MTSGTPPRVAPLAIKIRWMVRADLSAVLDIEEQSFSSPWSPKEFLEQLKKRTCIGLVAEDETGTVGYVIYELQADTIEIKNLAVHPRCRKQGVGSEIIRDVVRKLKQSDRSQIVAVVCETSLGAQVFLRSTGFICFEILRYKYEDDSRDGYVFRWDLYH